MSDSDRSLPHTSYNQMVLGVSCKNMISGAGKKAPAALPEALRQFSAPMAGGSQTSLTPASRDLTPLSSWGTITQRQIHSDAPTHN